MKLYFRKGMLLAAAMCFSLFPLAAGAEEKEPQTIDELVALYDESSCMECHEDIHAQWQDSWHAKAIVSSIGSLHNYLAIGVKQEWQTEITKAQIMKCFDCHAPIVEFASEKLAEEIGEMIITAHKKKGTPEAEKIKKELAKLNVGCLSCHNLKATTAAPGYNGPPEKNLIYGPHGYDAGDAHETEEMPDMLKSSFCMQCHGRHRAPDGELIQCNTLSGSYQNAYVAKGGSKTCQDCHMKKGHLFPGGHDLETVKEGIGFSIEVIPYTHLPGQLKNRKDPKKWVPSAIVTAFVENKTGHRVPDG